MGWDAFGLPAENAAVEHGLHPASWTQRLNELKYGIFTVNTCTVAPINHKSRAKLAQMKDGTGKKRGYLGPRLFDNILWDCADDSVLKNKYIGMIFKVLISMSFKL